MQHGMLTTQELKKENHRKDSTNVLELFLLSHLDSHRGWATPRPFPTLEMKNGKTTEEGREQCVPGPGLTLILWAGWEWGQVTAGAWAPRPLNYPTGFSGAGVL